MDQANQVTSSRARHPITRTHPLAMLLASLGTSIDNIALPTLTVAFDASFSQVQAVVVAYLAALTISVVLAGRLGDQLGLKPMLLAGLAAFLIATLLCAAAPNLWLLVAARAMQGVGAAFMMTLSMALLRTSVDNGQVGRAMGLLGTMSALGTALGPALGGLIIPSAGWRGIFWVQIPLAIIALVLAQAALPTEHSRTKVPAATLRSVLTIDLVPSLLVNLLVAAVMMTTLVVAPFYLKLRLGLTETLVGFVMTVGPVVAIASGVPSGRLVDAWGSHRVLIVGMAALSTGALLLAFLPDVLGLGGYVVSIIALTPGYQLFQAANNTHVLSDVPSNQRGTVSGLLSLSRNIGLVAGASIMGAVFAFGTGTQSLTHANPEDVASGMRLTFLLAGGMIIFALSITLKQRTPPRRQ